MERTVPTIIPSIAPETSDLPIDRLIHPAQFFNRPEDVLRDATLDMQEKRAILSSWASDACAVESMPALRKPPGATKPITFDAIMDALQQLDAIYSGVTRNSADRRNHERPERPDA